MSGKTLTLYSDALGPNGWKVAMVLNCLGIKYETIMVDVFGQGHGMPKDEFISTINENGRIPAIVDHSANDFTLWESGAIISYLYRKYDKDAKLSYPDFERQAKMDQFLYFQASGQGPYFGQLTWFVFYHEEKGLTSCINRYQKEVRRVHGVLEAILKASPANWLVGEKCTVADLSFVIWTDLMYHWNVMPKDYSTEKEFPHVHKWFMAMSSMPGVKSVQDEREAMKMRFK